MVAMATKTINAKKLRSLSDTFRPFFETLAKRERNRGELSVDAMERRHRDQPRAEIIRFFRELANAGAGTFKTGRGSKHSRFQWEVPMSEVAMLALGQADPLLSMPIVPPTLPIPTPAPPVVPAPQPAKTAAVAKPINPPVATPLHVHHLQLHSGKLGEMHVPHNMTKAEAEELAGYLMSIAL
jgi:hypothetical protein